MRLDARAPRRRASTFGPAGSGSPSSRNTAPWPPMIEPPAVLPGLTRVKPMPSYVLTGISIESGL